MGLTVYTVREGTLAKRGRIVCDAYEHAGPEDPLPPTLIRCGGKTWRVVDIENLLPSARPDANTLFVELVGE